MDFAFEFDKRQIFFEGPRYFQALGTGRRDRENRWQQPGAKDKPKEAKDPGFYGEERGFIHGRRLNRFFRWCQCSLPLPCATAQADSIDQIVLWWKNAPHHLPDKREREAPMTPDSLTESDEILFATQGRLGLITLNRQKALNALTFGMIEALARHYEKWAAAPQIYGIAMQSSSPRAFCAGADIKAIYHIGRVDPAEAVQFFRREYELNWALHCFSKPHLALIDGMVMGGGVGISRYGTHRVVTENASFAMPETGIGLFPDIGASWFLNLLPGKTGLYLGLTGRRIGAADMVALGLATHHVKPAAFSALKEALINSDPIDPVVDGLHSDPGPGELARLRERIDSVFSARRVEDIIERLSQVEGADRSWAEATRQALLARAPRSLKATCALLEEHRPMDLKQALETEFRLVTRILQAPDFYEGVRARLIDKDHKPRWQPSRLEDISDAEIKDMFAPLAEEELTLKRPESL